MAIVATLNTTFSHLNDDRSLSVKANSQSRERMAVVDIAIGSAVGDKYATNGIVVDFSVVRKFSKVYSCDIVHSTLGRVCTYIPATANAAATGKIKIWDTDGNELANESVLTQNKTLRVIIRGI